MNVATRIARFGGGAADPFFVSLGAATWTNGAYLDVPALGVSSLSAAFAPQVGSDVFTPSGTYQVPGIGIGGRGALDCNVASVLSIAAHWLAGLASGTDKTFTALARIRRDYPVGRRALWGFGHSTENANEFLDCGLPAGANVSPSARKDADAEATLEILGSTAFDYGEHVVAFRTDGTTGWIYVDGVQVATGSLDTLAVTFDRFYLTAHYNTVAAPVAQHFGGFLSHFAITELLLTPAQVAQVGIDWASVDLGTPGKPDGTKVQQFGDSKMQGDSDTYAITSTRGGNRYRAHAYLRLNRLRINFVGHRSGGISADPEHSSIGGANMSLIRSYINTYISTYEPEIVVIDGGTNDTDDIEAATQTWATFRTNYLGSLNEARDEMDLYSSGGQLAVFTQTPIQTGTAGATVVGTMNTNILSYVAEHEALYPSAPPVIIVDAHAAIGSWNATDYKLGTDPVHLGPVGYDKTGVAYNNAMAATWAARAA